MNKALLLLLITITSTSLFAKNTYTTKEIYNNMCIECHKNDGSGNTEKLTPSLVNSSYEELLSAMLEVEDGNGHIIMEHNREKIFEKGMQYDPKKMAKFMSIKFKNTQE